MAKTNPCPCAGAHQSQRRKRKRPWVLRESSTSNSVLATSVLLLLSGTCVNGFHSPVSPVHSTIFTSYSLDTLSPSRERICLNLVQERETESLIELPLVATTVDQSRETNLPPWLTRQRSTGITIHNVQEELEALEWKLLDHDVDTADITKAIYLAGAGDVELMMGIIDFLNVIVRLEGPSRATEGGQIATKEVLFASILHYVECVTARRDGIYDSVQEALLKKGNQLNPESSGVPSFPSTTKKALDSIGDIILQKEIESSPSLSNSPVSLRERLSNFGKSEDSPFADFEFFSADVLGLAKDASQIKRAEILAEVILSRNVDYERVQDMLISVSGKDFRALAIRCAASLYRLEGVLRHEGEALAVGGKSSTTALRNTHTVNAARSAIKIYAGLSQRMGLYVLKSKIERSAFEILYPRQYNVAKALFEQRGESMQRLSIYLRQQISHLMENDKSLMAELDDFRILCRVKEPFSAWKKLLRTEGISRGSNGGNPTLMAGSSRQLSLISLQDIVALRVILKAKSSDDDEPRSMIRSRERMLCYYVHHLIRSIYPETDPERVKDYIRNPKPNGYQSLHHTSAISMDDNKIPFEVQVRSEEMNAIAEFGLAAHWTYKQKQMILPANDNSRSLASAEASGTSVTIVEDPEDTLGKTELDVDGTDSDDTSGVQIMMPTSDGSGFGGNNINLTSPYLKALGSARKALESNVFCFLVSPTVSDLEQGQLVALQTGARIRDIVDGLDTDQVIATSSFSIHRNGKKAKWDEPVANGDVLLLLHHNIPEIDDKEELERAADVEQMAGIH